MSFTRKFKNNHETVLWWVRPNGGELSPYFDVDAVRERSRSYDKRNNLLGKNPGNVWVEDRVAFGAHSRATTHIAIYPESISERIIRSCSKPGDVVLDPFAGSGTTPAVARSLGRRWVAAELSEAYAEEAAWRIGTKQTSHWAALGSGIMKAIAFGLQTGSRPLHGLARAMDTWLQQVRLDRLRSYLDDQIACLGDSTNPGGPNGKAHKPRIWAHFDQLIGNPSRPNDPVAFASSLLDAQYRQRAKWNGLRKFRDTVAAIGDLQDAIGDAGSTEAIVRSLIDSEPSSYRIDGSLVELTRPLSLRSTRGADKPSSSKAHQQESLFGV